MDEIEELKKALHEGEAEKLAIDQMLVETSRNCAQAKKQLILSNFRNEMLENEKGKLKQEIENILVINKDLGLRIKDLEKQIEENKALDPA